MTRIDPQRIAEIMKDENFVRLTDEMKASFTKRVMARGTSPEERETALAEYHALEALLRRMGHITNEVR